MKQAIDAVGENGTFRPIQPNAVPVSDGRGVRITVEGQCEPGGTIQLAMSVYDVPSEKHVEEIGQIALDHGNFFDLRSAE